MKVPFHSSWTLSKKHIITLSCATALASFALITTPAFAEETVSSTAESTELAATAADTTETENSESSGQTVTSTAETTATEASSQTVTSTSETVSSETSSQSETTETETNQESAVSKDTVTATASENNSTGEAHYYSDSDGNWYYADANGSNLTGAQTIDGVQVYFDENGRQVKGSFAADGRYYDQDTGALWTNRYVSTGDNKWYYVDANGDTLKGQQTIDGAKVHFADDGVQTKGEEVESDGKIYYYDQDSGYLWTNRFHLISKNYYSNIRRGISGYNETWVYYGADGARVSGHQTIDGVEYAFTENGSQYKGDFVTNEDGTINYFEEDTGAKLYNNWAEQTIDYSPVGPIVTYTLYFDDQGNAVKGVKEIDGELYKFTNDGYLIKTYPYQENTATTNNYDRWPFVIIYNGKAYNPSESGKLVENTAIKNQYITQDNETYYLDGEGKLAKGAQTIDGVDVYFHASQGFQIKGDFAGYLTEAPTQGAYYDKDSGAKVTKAGWVETKSGDKFYLDDQGEKLLGLQTIDSQLYYFTAGGASKYIPYGRLVKGSIAYFEGDSNYARVYGYSPYANITRFYYFDDVTGEAVKNRFVQVNGSWYYFGADGKGLTGAQTINGQNLYFNADGSQVKGAVAPDGYYYDANSGERQ